MILKDAFGNEIVVGSMILIPTFARRGYQARRPAVVTEVRYRGGLYVRLTYRWVTPGSCGNDNSGHVARDITKLSDTEAMVYDVYVLEMEQVNRLNKDCANVLNAISLFQHAKRELAETMEKFRATKTS